MTALASTFTTNTPGTISWFTRHELNLAWRDFMRMMAAGRKVRQHRILAFMAIAAVILHFIAYGVLSPALLGGIKPDLPTLVMVTGTGLLIFSLMMSQALEMVTRAFYARSDLDLILSSPVSITRLFAVRVGAIAFSTTMLSLLLFAPAINILAWYDGAKWLAGYPLLFAIGFLATALSLAITAALFSTVGAKKTRLIAQIVAAVVGAGFIIGIQLAALSSLGTVSRFEFFASSAVLDAVPPIGNLVWMPASALMGDKFALVLTMLIATGVLLSAISAFAEKFGERVLAARSFAGATVVRKRNETPFRSRSAASHLRHKEWQLLMRDHWLVSQSLMQILYLLPPAYMLWQGFGNAGVLNMVLVPILVMATGQLAGGLAWLAISGEDAPDLVATAPVPPNAITGAKAEAVLGAIAMVTAPIVAVLLFMDIKLALITTAFILVSTLSATYVQLWFKSQAKRSNFRRRQTSSKIATITEAFSSILWAATAGLVSVGSWFATIPALLAFGVLALARSMR